MDENRIKYEFTTNWFDRHIPTWVRFLGHLKSQPIGYLEIGTFEGRSAVWMLENILTNKDSAAILVEPFEKEDGSLDVELEQRFAHNMLPWMRKIDVMRSRSLSALVRLYNSSRLFDVIYVDGSHRATHVLEDLVLGWNLLKPGGILIADDYVWYGSYESYKKPEVSIDAFIDVFGPELEVIHKDIQVFIRKKL